MVVLCGSDFVNLIGLRVFRISFVELHGCIFQRRERLVVGELGIGKERYGSFRRKIVTTTRGSASGLGVWIRRLKHVEERTWTATIKVLESRKQQNKAQVDDRSGF